uniref:Uncharacterized protein n=1 Tax=Anguilla anguilla TaxID=7936 RepID=A0A0E9W279_ANGAN
MKKSAAIAPVQYSTHIQLQS